MQSVRWFVAAVIGALTSCSKPPTQVSVFADTNVDRARPMSLALSAQYGAAPIEALRRADAVLLRADGRTLLPGSFSVVPGADGARSGLVTLLATPLVSAWRARATSTVTATRTWSSAVTSSTRAG